MAQDNAINADEIEECKLGLAWGDAEWAEIKHDLARRGTEIIEHQNRERRAMDAREIDLSPDNVRSVEMVLQYADDPILRVWLRDCPLGTVEDISVLYHGRRVNATLDVRES